MFTQSIVNLTTQSLSHLGLRNLFAKEQNLGQQVLWLVVVVVLGRPLRLKELVEVEPSGGLVH